MSLVSNRSVSRVNEVCLVIFASSLSALIAGGAEPSYRQVELYTANSQGGSRAKDWQPGEGISMEVSGMEWMGEDRLAVSLRKGEVWMIDHVSSDDPSQLKYQLFAYGLHSPLGLLKDGDDLLVGQRGEVTRLQDRDRDGVADAYLTECADWAAVGDYHAFTYGPKRDGEGQLWITLNLAMGQGGNGKDQQTNNQLGWHGWGGVIDGEGAFHPKLSGMRSPSGLGANREGDLFFSDQQGSWVPATPIYHMREGVFCGNQQALATHQLPDAPFKLSAIPKENVLYPEALASCAEFQPPAVWLPYNKMGRSATDIVAIDQDGAFGPFDGQLLVGEFTLSAINRVYLEKVGGEYQGACFPFLSDFPSAVVRMQFSPQGQLYVGMTNRGWSSLGSRSYGLSRVDFTGEVPLSILEMRALSDGFELVFTEALDVDAIRAEGAFAMSSYTYLYHAKYGSEEMDTHQHALTVAEVSEDGKRVRIKVEGLRPYYVHELNTKGLKSASGRTLDHSSAYYTLNRIPE